MKFQKTVFFLGFAVLSSACSPNDGSQTSARSSQGCTPKLLKTDPTCQFSEKDRASSRVVLDGEKFDKDGDGRFGMYCKGLESGAFSIHRAYSKSSARALVEGDIAKRRGELIAAGEDVLGFEVECSEKRGEHTCKAFEHYIREGWITKEITSLGSSVKFHRDAPALEYVASEIESLKAELKKKGWELWVAEEPSVMKDRYLSAANKNAGVVGVATVKIPGCR